MKLTVATVCVEGSKAKSVQANKIRILILQSVIKEIGIRGWAPDIVLLPGGYFFVKRHIGPFTHVERSREISKQRFAKVCSGCTKTVGAILVVGIDTKWNRHGDFGDEFCVAWDAKSIKAIGRKVFPVKGTGMNDESDGMVIYRPDLSTPKRLVPIQRGKQGLLCACYDMFGVRDWKGVVARGKNIRLFGDGDLRLDRKKKEDRNEVNAGVSEGLREWLNLVESAAVGLVAIHGFRKRKPEGKSPGSGSGYWQRNGIQRASKAIGGRLAFGAAHFGQLPKDASKVVLAAKKGRALLPEEHFFWSDSKLRAKALVRLYQV